MQPIEASAEREIMKRMKNHVPNIIMILVDGHENREVMVRTFSYGIEDAFRKLKKLLNNYVRRGVAFGLIIEGK